MESEPRGRSSESSSASDGRPEAGSIGVWSRRLLTWAGIVTVAVIALLASAHLAADVREVFGIRGGLSAVALRLFPTLVLALVGLGALALVSWLARSGGRRELAAIGFGFGCLLVIRLYTAATMDGGTLGEPLVYGLMAETMVTDEWDFFGRPMGFPAMLAVVYSVVEDRQLAAEIVNIGLAVLAGGAVLGLGRALYGARVAAIALLGYAVWPAAAMMVVVRIPQTAFDLVVIASAWAALGTSPGWKGSALTGAVVGLAQYLRPTAPILLPAYIVARMWPVATWRRHLLGAILPAGAFFLLVLTPVVLYNLERTGSPSISTSDFGGQTFYLGTYEPSGGTFDEDAILALIELAGSEDPIDRSRIGTEVALQRIREDPIGIAALAIRKQDTLWGTEHFGVQYAIKQSLVDRPAHPRATTPMLLSQGFYVLVLVSALGGMLLRRRSADALIPLVTLVIWAAAATHALLEVRDRHHSYVIPLLLPLAAFAISAVFARIERIRESDPDGASGSPGS